MATVDTQPPNQAHHDGNRRVLRHGRASITTSIAHAVVVKHDELFFLCDQNGDVPLDGSHGLGLYYHDCRYLNGYIMRVADSPAERLTSGAAAGFWATFELTNPDVKSPNGHLIAKESLNIKLERTLDPEARALRDAFSLTNAGVDPVEVPITIQLRSDFESLFQVRGAQPKRRGSLYEPRWDGSKLEFRYDGADHVRRTLRASFEPAPIRTDGTSAVIQVRLEPHETATIALSLQIDESRIDDPPARTRHATMRDVARVRQAVQKSSDDWIANVTRVRSSDPLLDRVVTRSLLDLHVLRTTLNDQQYFAAGVPWFVTLFGRDSIITALEALAFMPDRAEDTMRLLASFQGTHDDPWRAEAPGKIMHELRVGEMARLHEVPQTPYYGSVDATPLFLILLARHAAWTGRVDLFTELRSNVEAALAWIDDSMARAGGYLVYGASVGDGLSNQGWKDSGDSIMNRDGTLAEPPIALVEVQGYVYMAKLGIADLYRRAGDVETADRLATEADALRKRFEHDFWLGDLGTYALALQKDLKPAAVVSSNPGQALWTGIVSHDRAGKVVTRLMQEDMFSGWGIRTLATGERRYNPIGYHDGAVWPHDNAIVVAGCRRYDRMDDGVRVVKAIVDAATHFDHDRLPETFAGFSRDEFSDPVRYPVACHPQAWAAASVPFMIESALGLCPDGFNGRLRVVSPRLPEGVQSLTIDRLHVGQGTASIAFARDAHQRVVVQDVKVDGTLDVSCEPS